MKDPLEFRIIAGTHVGCVRTNNEDNFVLCPDLTTNKWFLPEDVTKPIWLGDYGCLMVVADGMGGANCGEVASEIAVETIKQHFSDSNLEEIICSDQKIEQFLLDTVATADLSIKVRAKNDKSSHGMGTTVIIAWVLEGNVHLAWCGDSRAYLYNPDNGLSRLTKDHSFVQSLIDKGELTQEQAFGHPKSNVITRCLGDFPSIAQPDYKIYTLQPSDVILLCTDGLCGYCADQEIETVFRSYAGDPIACRNRLIQSALDAGGFDNVTVALFISK